jgi:hypothetical protein
MYQNGNSQDGMEEMFRKLLAGLIQEPPRIEKIEKEEPEFPNFDIPTAAFSFMAKTIRSMFNAFQSEGFDENQSYELAYLLFDKTLSDTISRRSEN